MQKEDLIKLALSMNIDHEYEKFYRFAQNYARRSEMKNASSTDELFQCIKFCHENAEAAASRTGISGKGYNKLRNWSGYIMKCSALKELSLSELCYVFGCCARACKAKGEGC